MTRSPPVLVLGDSFLRIYETDEPGRGRIHRSPGARTATARSRPS